MNQEEEEKGPHMAYKMHYSFLRLRMDFGTPIMEGSFTGKDDSWMCISVLLPDPPARFPKLDLG